MDCLKEILHNQTLIGLPFWLKSYSLSIDIYFSVLLKYMCYVYDFKYWYSSNRFLKGAWKNRKIDSPVLKTLVA